MAIDWDRVVVETDNNGVVVSAGQVALLIGADADTVTWGNITGDIEQQPDLMALVGGYATTNSPTFTGTPRTVTPPAGNDSTRIASTAFVQGEFDSKDAPNNGKTYGRKNKAWSELGGLASKNSVNYETEVTSKPMLGTLSSLNSISYQSNLITDKPTLGALASKNTVDYETEVTGAPSLGALSYKNYANYETDVTNKPAFGTMALENDVPYDALEDAYYLRRYGRWHKALYNNFVVDCDDGNDETGDGSDEHPFRTIQKAIGMIPFEGQISIKPGSYYEDISVANKSITFRYSTHAQPSEAETIYIKYGFGMIDFAKVKFIGNFQIDGNLTMYDGCEFYHRNGSLAIHRRYSLEPLPYDDSHSVVINNSVMSVNDVSIEWSLEQTVGFEVFGTGRLFIKNLYARMNTVSSTVLQAWDGGFIQWENLWSDSEYETLESKHTPGQINSGSINSRS